MNEMETQEPTQSNNPFIAQFQERYAGKTYHQQIAQHLALSTVSYPLCLELRSLQGINILHLQKELLREYKQVIESADTSEEQLHRIRRLLADYASALESFETMTQRVVAPNNDSPYINGVIFPELAELNSRRSYPLGLRKLAKGRHGLSEMKDTAEKALLESRQRKIWVQETRLRFAMAIAGGLMLIVPVLIMMLVPSRTTSLVTVSIAVLIFSVLVAFTSTAKPQEVLAATAAYAAVLVVFVGTNASTI